ncbi:MAG TPA: hypothetical protein VFU62_07295 [Hanamia sp.]|nr:hypothetical protein [Hanamia sp.]
MKVIRFDNTRIDQWNNFNAASKNGLFLFERSYMDYHKGRFKDHSLMIFKQEKLLAIFPANENDKIIHSHAGLTFGGLIMSFNLKTTDCISILENIVHYYKSEGFLEINYKAISYIFQKYPSQEDLYALFKNNAVLYRRDVSSVVELSKKIKFSETKRQSVSKCEKEGIEIIENENFSDYWSLLIKVLSKYNTLPVHTLDEIHFLKNKFPQQIRLFEARLRGDLLAGIVIYDYGNVVHTQYMANSENGRKWGALDFINFRLINDYFKDY